MPTVIQIDRYDEYGKPQPGNSGRFQYTGQAWLDDLGTSPASGQGLYYYKSRMYAPHLGRFMQPDPIGYAGGLNLYAYVLNDPVNLVDPLGLQAVPPAPEPPPINVTLPSCGMGIRGHDANGYFCVIVTDTGRGFVIRLPNLVASIRGTAGGLPQKPTSPSPPAQPTHLACGVGLPSGGICGQVPDTKLCSGAKGRLAAIGALTAADTAVVGVNGLLKQLGKGLAARLLAAEVAADQVDVLKFCH